MQNMRDIIHVIAPDDVEAQNKLLHAFLQIRSEDLNIGNVHFLHNLSP